MGPNRIRWTRAAASLALLLPGACAGGQLARVAQLSERVAAAEREPADAAPRHYSLAQLVAQAQARAPDALRAELQAIIDEGEVDQLASTGLPRLGLETDYGRAAFVRRDDAGTLRISPALSWDVVRLLQRGRLRRLRAEAGRAATLRTDAASEAIELEVVRRYAEREAARANAELEQARTAAALRRTRLAELGGDNLLSIADEARGATGRLAAAQRRTEVADARLRHLAGLRPLDTVAPFMPAAEPAATAEPLSAYLARALANAEGLELAAVRAALADERARAVAAQRWMAFRFSAGGGDLLNLLSASPLALLNWTVGLLDGGDHQRQLARARADALLARLDRRDEADRLLDTAGRVWMAALDASTESERAVAGLRNATLAQRIAAAQAQAGAGQPGALAEAELSLAAARTELRLRELDALVARTQHRLLAGGPR